MQNSLAPWHCPWKQVSQLQWVQFCNVARLHFVVALCSFASTASVLSPQSLQHWWKVWRCLLCQCTGQKKWLHFLAASCYLSQQLCHRDHLLSIWLSKLHASIQVKYKIYIVAYFITFFPFLYLLCNLTDDWPHPDSTLAPETQFGTEWVKRWGLDVVKQSWNQLEHFLKKKVGATSR